MSHQNRFNRQRLVIQRFLFISLLVIFINFMLAILAVGQTNPIAANLSYSSSFVGAGAYDVAGWDVAFVGDVNRDGFGDLLVGAPENNKGGLRAGAAYLIFGSATLPDLSTSLTTADVTFIGAKSRDAAGMKIAGVCDINGDGFSDFVIAAPMENNSTGQIYLVFGKASGWQAETKLSEVDVIFFGENLGDNAGLSVASAGDVNNDGLSDLIIGAPRCDSKGNDAGKAYLVFGKKEGWSKNISLANADVIFEGETLLNLFGTSVAGIGDVNRDGIDDVAFGAPFYDDGRKKDVGKVYIFFGKGSFSTKIDASMADAALIGKNVDDLLGKYISNGGDINGDGIVDFSTTASLANGAGKIYLILGKTTGWSQNAIVEDFAPSFFGENPGDCAGVPTLITNLNKDGFSDLLISASKNSLAGKVYFIEGKATGWSQSDSLANTEIFMTGEKELDYAGQALAAGDFDNDGYNDIAVGAPGNDVAGVDAGIVYLFHSPFKPLPASLTLTAPNGGENWLVGSEQKINWTSEGDIEKVTLKYSTDNGVSWKLIVENTPNDGEHCWTVPDDHSTTCRVKVEDAVDGEAADQSDNAFTIARPLVESLKIISPNGGEKWLIGTQQQITWNWSGSFTEVKIEYSIDNGATWKLIDGCTPNDGVYDWTISNTPSELCRVKISDKNDATPADVSDAIFSIILPSESITVISPNGGECWHHGTTHEIKWSSTGLISNVKIQYSINGGKNWITIINSTLNDGSYQWTLPTVHSTDCLVKVADVDCNPEDVSDAKFTIWGKSPVTVISPNGGECLHADQEFEIKWEACCCLDSLKIQYSIDGGKDWTTIVYGTENDGKYLSKVPKLHSDSCLIKVADLDCDPEDISDSLFTIWGKAPVTVISPNGGECLKPGQQFKIKWEASCCLDSVKIQYSVDGGNDWTMIVNSTPNDGCHTWTVPEIHSTNCLVKVAGLDCDPQDISDKPFTIWNKVPVTVLSPNGGECLHAEQKFEIKWDASCCLDSLKIHYSINGGKEWKTIVYGTENDGKYLWTVPKVHSDSCLIKVADLDCDPQDVSDSLFTIWGKAPVTVVYPNGGECLKPGQKIKIKWEACCCLDSLKIQYSTDGGKDWTSIVYGTENDSSFWWTVPDVHSDNCLIKVADLDCDPEDTSDKSFTIWGKAPITVISPNGGECLKAGDPLKIKWEASCCLDSLKLQYSIDGGKDWTTIVYGTENDSCYTWTVPEVNSDSCLIKVADLDCDPEDISDSLFTICAQPFVTVFQPNGGDTLQTGQEYEIKWHACCFIDTVKIQYSIDGGQNWLSIVYRTENDSSYLWQVPNTPSESCLVKVADTDCDPFDTSDSLFVIVSSAMADFDATIMTGSDPLDVKFINLSTGQFNQLRWDFGDGNSSEEQSPTHRYEKPGNYSVRLMAFYPTGIDSITKTNLIQVHQKENFVQMEVVNSTPTLPNNDWTNAIDGDLYGWDGTTVLEGSQPNIIFSLTNSENKTVNGIGLLTDTGIGYEDRWIRQFQVQVSNGGIEPGDFQTVLDTAMTTGEMEVFSIQPTYAKYVKLIVTTPQSNLVHLGEFQAYFGEATTTSDPSEKLSIPDAFRLAQNYPNPFNPTTTIRFELPKSSQVKLEIYNILGEKIRSLFDGRKDAGIYELSWDGKNKDGLTVPSSVYLYILTTNEHREVRKMILTK